jgi:hypothetical protein
MKTNEQKSSFPHSYYEEHPKEYFYFNESGALNPASSASYMYFDSNVVKHLSDSTGETRASLGQSNPKLASLVSRIKPTTELEFGAAIIELSSRWIDGEYMLVPSILTALLKFSRKCFGNTSIDLESQETLGQYKVAFKRMLNEQLCARAYLLKLFIMMASSGSAKRDASKTSASISTGLSMT